MERVGVSELRQNLSAWLRRVQDGEPLEVTVRGKPVAVLAPLLRKSDPLALVERRGQIARRGDRTPFSVPTLRSPRPTEELLTELREDRGLSACYADSSEFACYDTRLAEAAADSGLSVVAPA